MLPHGDAGRRAALLAPWALGLAAGGQLEAALEAAEEALRLTPADAELVEVCAQLENLLGRHDDAGRRLPRR